MKVNKFRKKEYAILGILITLFVITFLNIFINFINQGILSLITLGTLILSSLIIGFQKNKSIIEKDVILTIIIFMLSFNIIIYLLGLFIGFTKGIYNMQIISLLKTILPIIIYIVLIVILIITFILMDNTIIISDLCNTTNAGIMLYVKQLGLFVVPSIISNIYFTYQSSKVGYKSTILYRLFMELPLYIIPIYPDFGNYILSVIRITIPTVFIIYLYNYLSKINKTKIIIKKNPFSIPLKLFIFGICFTLVYFVCGKFRYQAYVIASGSMTPKINIGDVVIVDKKSNDDLEIGDVIAFKKDNKVYCHRINDIIKSNKTILYETKGDNNKDVDQLLIKEEQIVGKTNFRIKYIGYPTVWLINR